MALLANERYGRAVRLKVAQTRGKLDLSSKTEMGDAQETLNLDYDGPEMAIGFNARYLLDFLSVVESPSVQLGLDPQREGDPTGDQKVDPGDKPGELRPDPEGDFTYRYVVMPMHL